MCVPYMYHKIQFSGGRLENKENNWKLGLDQCLLNLGNQTFIIFFTVWVIKSSIVHAGQALCLWGIFTASQSIIQFWCNKNGEGSLNWSMMVQRKRCLLETYLIHMESSCFWPLLWWWKVAWSYFTQTTNRDSHLPVICHSAKRIPQGTSMFSFWNYILPLQPALKSRSHLPSGHYHQSVICQCVLSSAVLTRKRWQNLLLLSMPYQTANSPFSSSPFLSISSPLIPSPSISPSSTTK